MSREGIDELLRMPCCQAAVREFVDKRLRLRYQASAPPAAAACERASSWPSP
jgi:hypothetical protein